MNRRRFLKAGLVAGASMLLPWQRVMQVLAQGVLDPLTQPKFANPLPVLANIGGRFDVTGGGTHEVRMTQFSQQLGLVDPVTGAPLSTTVWGYQFPGQAQGTYPGFTFVARRDVPVDVRWVNALEDAVTGDPLPHVLPVDTSIHWANPAGWPGIGVPVVTHLHGGHSESASDGLPEAWFTPQFVVRGAQWVKETFYYDNDQEAGTLWYHDHALGITRLNVYAGLAGFYLLRDANEDALIAANAIPSGPYEIEIVIQDRMFTADGQLFYPSTVAIPGAPTPSVLPEFFGNIILVNGMSWPFLNVEPRKYRFRLLNGSDSRFYNLFLSSGQPFIQIGTDGGFLNAPVPVAQLTIGPGERADVVVDFAPFTGQTIVMRNNAKIPFPMGATVNPHTTGQIMVFNVGNTPVADPVTLPANLRPVTGPFPPAELANPVRTRQLILFEGVDEFGRLQPLLGTVAGGTRLWADPITENPNVGDVEVWEIYNTTPDAHPIHLHLVTFQILNRQRFRAMVGPTGALTGIRLLGQPKPAEANELGPKDTAQMFPGEVTRIVAKFDRPGRYVWHCHILSHEDHEMMRPYYVGPVA